MKKLILSFALMIGVQAFAQSSGEGTLSAEMYINHSKTKFKWNAANHTYEEDESDTHSKTKQEGTGVFAGSNDEYEENDTDVLGKSQNGHNRLKIVAKHGKFLLYIDKAIDHKQGDYVLKAENKSVIELVIVEGDINAFNNGKKITFKMTDAGFSSYVESAQKWQADMLKSMIEGKNPGKKFEVKAIVTSEDIKNTVFTADRNEVQILLENAKLSVKYSLKVLN